MADPRNQKQKEWEGSYINKVRYLNDVLESMKEHQDYAVYTNLSSLYGGPTPHGGVTAITEGTSLELVQEVISANEGGYTTVVGSDNGHGVSLGKFQWHEDRAKALLQKMRNLDQELFDSTLITNGGASVIDKLTWKSWDEVKFNDAEVKATQRVLEIPKFQRVQDEQMVIDLKSYIKKANDLGIVDPRSVAYFADLYNQSPARAIDIAKIALRQGGNLESLHRAALANEVMGRYKTRRNNTYNKILSAKITSTAYNNATIQDIPIARIVSGRVIPPDVNRKQNQVDLYNIVRRMNANEFVSLDPARFSFPNGEHSNMFLPHFAQIMNLLHAKVTPELGVTKLIISSGLRTQIIEVEKEMGVVSISPHMAGIACDIYVKEGGERRFIIADTAWGLGIRAIGVGKDHVHIDAGPQAFWKEHDETRIYKGPGRWELA